jgi:hypothetical protein
MRSSISIEPSVSLANHSHIVFGFTCSARLEDNLLPEAFNRDGGSAK